MTLVLIFNNVMVLWQRWARVFHVEIEYMVCSTPPSMGFLSLLFKGPARLTVFILYNVRKTVLEYVVNEYPDQLTYSLSDQSVTLRILKISPPKN